jgi:hypothetical protein
MFDVIAIQDSSLMSVFTLQSEITKFANHVTQITKNMAVLRQDLTHQVGKINSDLATQVDGFLRQVTEPNKEIKRKSANCCDHN